MTSIKPNAAKVFLLIALFGLGVNYLWGDLSYAISRDRTGESTLRVAITVLHVVCAAPLLLLPPLQFSRRIRARWPAWHRWAGRTYLLFGMLAAVGAMYLAVHFEETGRRPPLLIFAVLWLFFSGAAWICARRRKFSVHEMFVVRSYAVALGFVFVRLLGEFEHLLLPFIESEEVRGVTREWLCFVLPLLIVESFFVWWPATRPSVTRPTTLRGAG